MLENKRKRAVVLALLAFFCTAAATYVAVEWKRVGGSLVALAKGKDDKSASDKAVAMSVAASLAVAKAPAIDFMPQDEPAHEPEVALVNTRRQVASVGGGADSFKGKSDDDLFKDGDPAAGIPPGKFIVAQNDTPSERGPDPIGGIGGGGNAGGALTGPAPAPTGNGGSGGGGLLQSSTPVTSPPAGTPSEPTPPAAPTPAIPEASSLAMMTLGGLFLAVAAARRRHQA